MNRYCHGCGYGEMVCECPKQAKVVFYWSDRRRPQNVMTPPSPKQGL
jgi:hypothetical protein